MSKLENLAFLVKISSETLAQEHLSKIKTLLPLLAFWIEAFSFYINILRP